MKTLPLLFDFLDIAPNTKVLSKTLGLAMKVMLQDKSMEIIRGQSESDVIDKCDVTIRMLLWWLRTLKSQPDAYVKLQRQCSAAELAKLILVMNKVILPPQYEDEEEQGSAAVAALDTSPGAFQLALVAPPPTSTSVRAALSVFKSINEENFEGQGVATALAQPKNTLTPSNILAAALAYQPPKTSSKDAVKASKSTGKAVKTVQKQCLKTPKKEPVPEAPKTEPVPATQAVTKLKLAAAVPEVYNHTCL